MTRALSSRPDSIISPSSELSESGVLGPCEGVGAREEAATGLSDEKFESPELALVSESESDESVESSLLSTLSTLSSPVDCSN